MCNDHDHDLIDLGDAVAETKGTAIVGAPDPLGGARQNGLSADD